MGHIHYIGTSAIEIEMLHKHLITLGNQIFHCSYSLNMFFKVVDLISLKPFDMETISKSVKKTRRVLIVEECMKTGGIGASLSAVISESLFDDLDHQVMRLSSQDVPTAYAFELEASTIVQPENVVTAVEQMVGKGALV